ncbi:MAG: class I SAM-dependent methyltransferase [Blastocatellia bacterium]
MSLSGKFIDVDEPLYQYLLSVSLREPDFLRDLRAETAVMPEGGMQIAPEQGQLMALLIEMLGAKKALEVGVFTGYSSTAVALALPHDGKLIACDVSEHFTSVARKYWRRAGVEDKIELRLGPAVETLDGMLAGGQAGTFDFAFIDADKANYDAYYERGLQLVRTGGLIVIDNTLWHRHVLDPADQTDDTVAIRALNEKLHHDARVTLSMLAISDGLTLARKKG